MTKIPVSLRDAMVAGSDPNMALTTSPFAPGKLILKRIPYPRGGGVPTPLRGYEIKSGECAGRRGTAVYKGKLVPATALCVAQKRSRGRRGREEY